MILALKIVIQEPSDYGSRIPKSCSLQLLNHDSYVEQSLPCGLIEYS